MKIKKSKFVVGALLSIISVSVVGSITSTFAWYTYNTKDTLSYTAIATGKSENLLVKVQGGDKYKSDITCAEIVANSVAQGHAGSSLEPITLKATQEADKPLGTFALGPSYLSPNTEKAAKNKEGKDLYFQTSLFFICPDPTSKDSSGTITNYLEKNIYISYLNVIMKTSDGDGGLLDISDAIRMHINSGDKNYLIAPGCATTSSINLYGDLDLNGDGEADAGWKQQDGTYSPFKGDSTDDAVTKIPYGVQDAKETALGKQQTVSTFTDGTVTTAGIVVAQTNGGTSLSPVQVNITIWLEGWAASTIDPNINAEFELDMIFQVEDL